MIAGTSWCGVQSPPPMTLPARAEATATPCSARRSGGKKEATKDCVTSSEQALLFEYGSRPPSASFSR